MNIICWLQSSARSSSTRKSEPSEAERVRVQEVTCIFPFLKVECPKNPGVIKKEEIYRRQNANASDTTSALTVFANVSVSDRNDKNCFVCNYNVIYASR